MNIYMPTSVINAQHAALCCCSHDAILKMNLYERLDSRSHNKKTHVNTSSLNNLPKWNVLTHLKYLRRYSCQWPFKVFDVCWTTTHCYCLYLMSEHAPFSPSSTWGDIAGANLAHRTCLLMFTHECAVTLSLCEGAKKHSIVLYSDQAHKIYKIYLQWWVFCLLWPLRTELYGSVLRFK